MGSDHERQRGGARIPAPFFVTWSPVPYNNSREVGALLVNVIRAVKFGTVLWCESHVGQHIGFGIVHECRQFWHAGSRLVGHA